MPAYLSIASALDKNRIASAQVYLLLLEVDILDPTTGAILSTVYATNNNEPVPFGGHVYIALPFTVDLADDADNQPTCTLAVTDFAQVFQGYLQAYGGALGWPARFKVINASAANPVAELEQDFFLNGAQASGDSYEISFMVTAENPLTLRFPPRQQFRNRCFWQFKDGNCQYGGSAATCDLTFDGPNGCMAHNNTLNYGGFYGITQTSAYSGY